MSNHTTGPWSVVKDTKYPGIYEVDGPSFGVTAVMVATDLDLKDYMKRSADLRLIAAAPDLYKALKMVTKTNEFENLADEIQASVFSALNKAETDLKEKNT